LNGITFHALPFVIARFMRAIQFFFSKRKMDCPDEPGNDEVLIPGEAPPF
jgi:hypothetical protein